MIINNALGGWASWRTTLLQLSYKTYHRAICGLLLLWLLLVLTQWLLRYISSTADVESATLVSSSVLISQEKSQVDLRRLQSYRLFGGGSPASVAAEVRQSPIDTAALNAKKTRLAIQLQGVVQASNDVDSLAMIAYQGAVEQYRVGDKLPAGIHVVLSKVRSDRVILNNNGRIEALWLYEESGSVTGQSKHHSKATARPVTDFRNNRKMTQMAKSYKERLYSEPNSLAEVLQIAPVQKDGQMIGYRISPGKDKKLFRELGLQANDIVTSINGIDLSEPSKALEVYKIIRSAQEATFTIDREGEFIELMVSLKDDDS